MKYIGISILLLALLSGCASRKNQTIQAPIVHKQAKPDWNQLTRPTTPKKHIKLKEVDDTNFDDKYMYPEDTVKKETAETSVAKTPTMETPITENSTIPTPVTTTGAMTKEECVSMITQEKFDKYSQMFGNENASIKRCAMLKAMRK